ncbi:hypothetical protein H5410_051565 [Solanum commersonii]|uniref:Uncharacterized protein n=1 Tax=Solanum commersonii TaxID=4109 RepID=A0A9J5WYT8_SOLCO|nr:hypothetical protein H5410_051565 [Solanum commersonii]
MSESYETTFPQDIIEKTCDNSRIKEKKKKVSNYMGKDFSISSASEGTDGKGSGKKRERVGEDLDCTLSQNSADAEDSSREFDGSIDKMFKRYNVHYDYDLIWGTVLSNSGS